MAAILDFALYLKLLWHKFAYIFWGDYMDPYGDFSAKIGVLLKIPTPMAILTGLYNMSTYT